MRDRGMILSTLSRECCGNASAISTLGVAPRRGGEKEKEKKSDRVYAVTTPEGYPVGPELWLACRKRVDKKITWLSTRRDVAKVLTELSAGGGSITRRESRQNFPAETGFIQRFAPSRCTERRIRGSKRDYILGVEWRRHVPSVRSNFRRSATTVYADLTISRPFPRCVLLAC